MKEADMDKLRMCVACREMQDKRNLLRIVKDKEGNVSIDYTGKKNGRGAYICNNEECLKKCMKQKSFNKAFKTNIDEKIYKEIEEAILERRKN
ncbi:MAG: YlxR family protein [Clostridia bacterium]|nr:YlxR family protein [Clostridia bacterium]